MSSQNQPVDTDFDKQMAQRRRSRRMEGIVAAAALAVILIFAITHRQQIDKPLTGEPPAPPASTAH